jgi:Flp pilus assembly protein TadG
VLPLLILLALTSVDFGRFAYAYLALGNAGRVGSEVGATRSYSTANAAAWRQQVISAVHEDFSSVGGLDSDLLVIDVETTSDAYDLQLVTVTTTYPFSTTITWPGIPRPLNMQRKIAFRRFR